ncbi:MAG: glucose-6-phosphate isomerase [Microbacteriaceae bacterium]
MSIRISVSGATAEAVERHLPTLLEDLVASRITAQDNTLWGAAAESEAAVRLGWTEAVAVSLPLVTEITELRDSLHARGVDRVVLCGMGGSSLAPEVITGTARVPLVVLDSTDPGQVREAVADGLERTVVVVASKSGSTVETDSQKRAFEAAFADAGIDPLERIVIVTDPGSPLDVASRSTGYRVFNADPNVGGRYSALTAFGLVPSGLAGADIAELLDEAQALELQLAVDRADNPGLILGAAIAGTEPLRNKLAVVSDGTHIVGLPDWVEQLVAESTGKLDRGILPVVLGPAAPELRAPAADLAVARLVHDAGERLDRADGSDDIHLSGTLGAQFMVWEYATAVAGRILGINPFDQPDVESAKSAARELLDAPPAPAPAAFVSGGIEVRGTPSVIGASSDLESAIEVLLEELPSDGYLSVHAYLDRNRFAELAAVRDALAARSGRPVTFGWGPRFLHSTGQFHKGGPKNGVFLQITERYQEDQLIPGRPFSFGQLIGAQASGDAKVLAAHGLPVLTLTLTNAAQQLDDLRNALS